MIETLASVDHIISILLCPSRNWVDLPSLDKKNLRLKMTSDGHVIEMNAWTLVAWFQTAWSVRIPLSAVDRTEMRVGDSMIRGNPARR